VTEQWLSISDFAGRCRLSPKALRLYGEMGLLVPVRVDATTGYRWYSPEQVQGARTVALLRQLQMPLSRIAEVIDLPRAEAAAAVRSYWAEVEVAMRGRRAVADYLCGLLEGGTQTMEHHYDVQLRSVPARAVISGMRHVHAADAGAVLGGLLGRMGAAGPGLSGIEGCPYTTYYGAVSEDSDGPVEVVRPVIDLPHAQRAAGQHEDLQARVEDAHDEAYVRLTMAEVGWPEQLPVLDAIEDHLRRLGREPATAPRQVMIADWRTAGPDTPACDLAVPLKPA
jgi:DNA-binding transcriptional MerR regulator